MADTHAARLPAQGAQVREDFLALTEKPPLCHPSAPMTLLVVDDDEKIREVCRCVAADSGLRVVDVGTAEEALEVLEFSPVDILLTDLRLPGTNGLDLLKKVSVAYPDVAVVMLTQYGTIDSAVEATRFGAADYGGASRGFCGPVAGTSTKRSRSRTGGAFLGEAPSTNH